MANRIENENMRGVEGMSSGTLYVVATPIGNLGDLSRRAEDVLKSVQIVAAEDTRRTAVLLQHIGHRAPELLSVHEHNEDSATPELIARLQAGASIALVSDAGTPLINDPGFTLVSAAYEAGISVVPIPGASSLTTFLSVCPLPCQPFQFVGFLPPKGAAKEKFLADCLTEPHATLFLESPKRIHATLSAIAQRSERPIMIGRELTKQFETFLYGTATEVLNALGDESRGEFIGLISAQSGSDSGISRDAKAVLQILLKELKPAQAAKLGAQICGMKKSQMYELALWLEEE